jgi:hypothetical protein
MTRIATLCALALLLFGVDAAAQQWRYVESMATPRRMHTATLIADGRVLVTGGTNERHRAVASCELFDVSTLGWSPAPAMSIPRERHTATLLDDGRVVVIAGNTTDNMANHVTASIEIYDPVTGVWSFGGSLVTARQNHTATLLPNGTILVTGGYNENKANVFLSSTEIYDPLTMTSRSAAPLPKERMDHGALLLHDGRVLVVGGRIGGWDGNYLSQADIYDPSRDEWSTIDPMAQSRIMGFTLACFSDSTVLVAGGRKAPTSSGSSAEVLDTRYSQWQVIDTMRLPVTWQAGAMLAHDRYLVTGGFTDAVWQSPNSVLATGTCEWYDKAARTWFFAPELNQVRAEHTIVTFTRGHGDRVQELVMVMGGITGDESITSTCEILDVDEASMASYARGQIPSGRIDFGSNGGTTVRLTGNGSRMPSLIITSPAPEAIRVELIGADGRSMRTLVDRWLDAGTLRLPMPRELASGAYIVKVSGATGELVEKVVVRQ